MRQASPRHDHHQGHAHSQPHTHGPADFGRAFAVGIGLNISFVVLEVAFGAIGNSVALLADAGHNLSDVLGLVVAWSASELAKRAPSPRFTYGFGGTSILAALFNAMFLLVIVGGLSWEAILRLLHPQPVAASMVMIVAAIGIVLNGASALLFAAGRTSDLNVRGAFVHMAADALVSAGVVAAGLAIAITGWLWLDPFASLLVNAVIVIGTWGLLRDSFAMAISAVPSGIDPAAVRATLVSPPGVAGLHDLHVWPMSTTETALTAHLVMPGGHPGDEFLMRMADELKHRFGIGHVTLQVEVSEKTECALAPPDRV